MSLQFDPTLLKAHMRAGTAHWKLGNLRAAAERYEHVCSQPAPPEGAANLLQELKQFVENKNKVLHMQR